MDIVYKKIKDLRIAKGMTQDELAKLSGYTSRASINHIEQGKTDISRSKLNAIAKALGVSPLYLMDEDCREDSLRIKVASHPGLDRLIDIACNLSAENLEKLICIAEVIGTM